MRLLLTGFEPFGGETLNPSWEVVRAIEADPPDSIELRTLCLPVVAGVSADVLVPELAGGAYDAWLGLGLAEGRDRLCVERVGINLRSDRLPDGSLAEDEPVSEDGPAAYFSQLPVAAIARAIEDVGVPARVSNTAGTYICNEVMYAVQHHLALAGRELPSGFIHLPYLPEQLAGKPEDTAALPLEAQVRGVRAAIEFLREHLRAHRRER